MGMWIGRNRKARVTYGFDEIALVPGDVTINPNEVDTSFQLGPHSIRVPIMASAMDGVVDVQFAIEMGKLGGVAVFNLEGVQTRYKNPDEVLDKIVNVGKDETTHLLQRIYTEPIQEDLIAARIKEIKDAGVLARSVQFRNGPSASARLPRKRARTYSSCNPPSRPSATFPANTRRSISPRSARR